MELDRDTMRQRLALIREYMLCRQDRLCHKARWNAPCPVEAEAMLSSLIRSHLTGETIQARWVSRRGAGWTTGPQRLGSYCPTPDGLTKFACIDCDGGAHSAPLADPLAAAAAIMDELRWACIPSYLERSKSGEGWHVWIFFARMESACVIRRTLLKLIPRLPLTGGGLSDARRNIGVELFPKQCSHDYLGNQVWLPWWHGAKGANNQFCWITPDGQPRVYQPTHFETVMPRRLAELDPGEKGVAVAPAPAPVRRGRAWRRQGPPTPETLLRWALGRVSPGTPLGRNKCGFDLALALRDNGYPPGEAEGVLLRYAQSVPGSGYMPSEALASLRQAYLRPARGPWGST